MAYLVKLGLDRYIWQIVVFANTENAAKRKIKRKYPDYNILQINRIIYIS